MTDKQKNTENEAQIIKSEDLAKHNSRGIYMRDDHCDWGSSLSLIHISEPTRPY